MVLLGPATENHTYLLIAPAAALALVESFGRRQVALRILASVAYLLLLLAILRIGFWKVDDAWLLALQPFGGIALLCYALPRYLGNYDDR